MLAEVYGEDLFWSGGGGHCEVLEKCLMWRKGTRRGTFVFEFKSES